MEIVFKMNQNPFAPNSWQKKNVIQTKKKKSNCTFILWFNLKIVVLKFNKCKKV